MLLNSPKHRTLLVLKQR